MNKTTFKILLTSLFALILGVSLFFVFKEKKFEDSGSITIQIINVDKVVKEKEIEYENGDELLTLISKNFDGVVIRDGMLYEIEGIITPSDWSYFFWIKVNGKDSEVGLGQLQLQDGDTLQLVFTKNNYS